MKNFWEKLPKPIFALAPLANVTDAAFRRIIAKYGKPPLMWTEFVSADGLFMRPKEGNPLFKDLLYTEAERPIVAQFFTSRPEMMERAAALARELGFDGVDINMGCPDRAVEKQGAGAALMKNPELAKKVIRAAKHGAGDLPVSVKTRIGYNRNELDTWLPALIEEEPAAITIHARTRKEMSKVPARWEHVREAVQIRNSLGAGGRTLILGNGDVVDLEDAKRKAEETGADGVMLGRAIFGTPWLFATACRDSRFWIHDSRKRLEIMLEHTKLFEELLGDVKSFSVMKKHYKAYVSGFPGAAELRAKLMETKNSKEVEKIVSDFLSLCVDN